MSEQIRKAHAAERRKRRKHGLWGGLALLLGGTVTGAGVYMDPIGDQLAESSKAALEAKGFSGLSVEFEGREGTVSGVAHGDSIEVVRKTIEDIVEAEYGVRWADVSAVTLGAAPRKAVPKKAVPKPPPAMAKGVPEASMKRVGAKVTLRGALPSQARIDTTVAAAKKSFGPGNVVNQLTVNPKVADPAWVGGLSALVPAMKPVHSAGFRTVGGKSLVLTGYVKDEAERTRIGVAAKKAAPGLSIDNQIKLLLIPNVALTSAGKHVTLRGKVPTAEVKTKAGAQAEQVFGAGNVTNQLTIAPTQAPGWLPKLWSAFPHLKPVRTAGLATRDGKGLILTGTVDSAQIKAAIGKSVADACPDLAIDNQIKVIEAVKEAKQTFEKLMREVQGKGIYFETASSEISARGAKHLDKVVNLLEVVDSIKVLIAGHTDSVGKDRSNMKLSRERANSVRAYLTNKGINPKRLRAKGYGESRPVAKNDTEEGRAQNRRIDFVVEGK